MKYSDKELKEATQIAYLSLLEKGQDALETTGQVGPYTLEQIIRTCIDEEAAKKACIERGILENEITFQDLVQNSDISPEDKERIKRFDDKILGWKIIDINDFNQENGMYACLIETGEKDAVVAFRGSENMKKYKNLVNDWVKADFALLNSEETEQQKTSEEYLDSLVQHGLLNKYNSLAVTGHSLGGNLASHFTVSAAEPGREEVFNKIDQCINFDGPGVSNEYIKKHKDAIDKSGSKITHYSWSAVGKLLFSIPGEKKAYLGINKDLYKDSPIDRFRYLLIRRHDTRSLLFDQDGKAKRGRQDIFSMLMSGTSKILDAMIPASLTDELYFALSTIFKCFTYEKQDGSIGFKLPFMKVKEKAAENPFCKKCGEILKVTVENFRNKFHLFTRDPEHRKSGFADIVSGMQGDRAVRTNSINELINNIGKDLGKQDIALAR